MVRISSHNLDIAVSAVFDSQLVLLSVSVQWTIDHEMLRLLRLKVINELANGFIVLFVHDQLITSYTYTYRYNISLAKHNACIAWFHS